MNANPRAPRDIPPEEPVKNPDFVENFATLYKKTVECVADIQNRSIDCAMQHEKEAIELCKQMTEKLPWAPRVNLFDGLAGSLERFAEIQKAAINFAVEQNRGFAELVKERAASAGKTAGSMSKFAQQSFERSVAAQKKATEATLAEAKSAFEKARERFAVPGDEAVAESIRHGVDTIIDAQKEVLETASKGWTPARETVHAS